MSRYLQKVTGYSRQQLTRLIKQYKDIGSIKLPPCRSNGFTTIYDKKDILIAGVDGLKGLPDAINTVYPNTQIQLCIVHMVRNSLKFVPWKDYKAITGDLKRIYQSITEDEALMSLGQFEQRWDSKYPSISRSWRNN